MYTTIQLSHPSDFEYLKSVGIHTISSNSPSLECLVYTPQRWFAERVLKGRKVSKAITENRVKQQKRIEENKIRNGEIV